MVQRLKASSSQEEEAVAELTTFISAWRAPGQLVLNNECQFGLETESKREREKECGCGGHGCVCAAFEPCLPCAVGDVAFFCVCICTICVCRLYCCMLAGCCSVCLPFGVGDLCGVVA